MEELIDLDFFDPIDKYGVIKATIHKSGKLGFSSGAAKVMELEKKSYFNIGFNKANSDDKSLYMIPLNGETEKSFKVVKAGDYYYIFIKHILRDLQLDYKAESIIFDIEEVNVGEKKCYKLVRRKRK
ncbi:MAG TPA: hypothetical protein PKZ51_12955 [Saprospiraceae bacterium]|jgi:hypothetical protein|nr:hypothetical protein [Ferruginibacter sp.]MBN8700362.1 hypothetical protein [Chitinophagales bacterium]HNA65627.1 hypothetical protein [Saprospiraceae bacterium]